jgi:predicted nucleic acid-binding protein
VALTFQSHFHHDIARAWFESLDPKDEARLCFCRITQLSFLRLITTETVMGKDEVLSQRQAWDVYDRWFEDSRIFSWRNRQIWKEHFAEFRGNRVWLRRIGQIHTCWRLRKWRICQS